MLGQAGHNVLAVAVQAIGLVLVLVGLVYDGSAKRARGYTKIVSELEPLTQKYWNSTLKSVIDIRGRSAWRMFGVSVPAVVAFATCCRGVDEKARQLRDDRAADPKERPVPSRIKDREAAIVITTTAARGVRQLGG